MTITRKHCWLEQGAFVVMLFEICCNAAARPADRPPQQDAPTQQRGGEQGWGEPARGGLRARLTRQTQQPTVGKPLLLKLEIGNFGTTDQALDPQFYSAFRALRMTRPDGGPEPMIAGALQTSGFENTLKPGEQVVLWENVDAAELFLLAEPGRYAAQVRGGKWGLNLMPGSHTLELELAPGTLPDSKRMYQRLLEVAPAQWQITLQQNVLYASHQPTGLKKDATTVQIWFPHRELPKDYALGVGENRQEVAFLGASALGPAYAAAPQRAAELWPDYVQVIKKALGSQPPAP